MGIQFNELSVKLEPELLRLESKRLELKGKGSRTGRIVAGGIVAAGIVFMLCQGFSLIGGGVTGGLALILWACCVGVYSKEFSAFYKQHVISVIVEAVCRGAAFTPDAGIPEAVFNGCGLFRKGPDRYHSEDFISGKVDKTNFCCAEVHAEEKVVTRNSKGQTTTHWVDIFKGFLFIADFQKDFRGHTVIFRNSWFKWGRGGDRMKLENLEFEQRFDVYSTDQVEARYLLTPLFMEKLLALDNKFPGKITVGFRGSKVIVAIPDSKNHFEAGIWRSVNPDMLRGEFEVLHSVIGIVADLNLNVRIWSKA